MKVPTEDNESLNPNKDKKRMRQDVDDIEKDDFESPKKHYLRKKRQKFIHKDVQSACQEIPVNCNDVQADVLTSCASSVDCTSSSTTSTLSDQSELMATTESIEIRQENILNKANEQKTRNNKEKPELVKEYETITIKDIVPCFDNVKYVIFVFLCIFVSMYLSVNSSSK